MQTPYRIPENFFRLWKAHDDLLDWAQEKLDETEYLKDHVDAISTYLTGVKFAQESDVRTDRHTALCGLFMRSFEMLSLGLRSSMTGSYHSSAMVARDLIETAFLLDFLMDSDGEPERWLNATLEEVRGKYSPRRVPEYLDHRDGFTKKKRKAHFDILSTLGAHPTPHSLNLRRDGQRNIRLGPFKQSDLLRECIEELARCTITLYPRLLCYVDELPESRKAHSALALRMQKTRALYYENK